MMSKNNLKGVIALTTLIVVTAVLVMGGITLLLTSIDTSTSVESATNSVFARLQARGCLEESILRIQKDPAFTGTVPLSYPASYSFGDCQAIVTDDGPNTKKIDVTSTFEEFVFEKTRRLDTSTDPMQLID